MNYFKKSTKVNTNPMWSLRDYAEKRGMTKAVLGGLKARHDDFPKPAVNVRHGWTPKGKDLFYVRELDAWFKKYREANGQ